MRADGDACHIDATAMLWTSTAAHVTLVRCRMDGSIVSDESMPGATAGDVHEDRGDATVAAERASVAERFDRRRVRLQRQTRVYSVAFGALFLGALAWIVVDLPDDYALKSAVLAILFVLIVVVGWVARWPVAALSYAQWSWTGRTSDLMAMARSRSAGEVFEICRAPLSMKDIEFLKQVDRPLIPRPIVRGAAMILLEPGHIEPPRHLTRWLTSDEVRSVRLRGLERARDAATARVRSCAIAARSEPVDALFGITKVLDDPVLEAARQAAYASTVDAILAVESGGLSLAGDEREGGEISLATKAGVAPARSQGASR